MIDQIDQIDESTEDVDVPVIPDGYIDVNTSVMAPEYHVEQASAKLELYTLKEAVSDERFVDMFAPLFAAGVITKPAEPFAKGLLIFAQPQVDEAGEFYEHSAELRASSDVPAQDLVVVIARTSARVRLDLDILGRGELSRTLVILAQEGAEVRVHSRAKDGMEGRMKQEMIIVAGDHAKVTVENIGIASEVKKIVSDTTELSM